MAVAKNVAICFILLGVVRGELCEFPIYEKCTCQRSELGGILLMCSKLPQPRKLDETSLQVIHIIVKEKQLGNIRYAENVWPRLLSINDLTKKMNCKKGQCLARGFDMTSPILYPNNVEYTMERNGQSTPPMEQEREQTLSLSEKVDKVKVKPVGGESDITTPLSRNFSRGNKMLTLSTPQLLSQKVEKEEMETVGVKMTTVSLLHTPIDEMIKSGKVVSTGVTLLICALILSILINLVFIGLIVKRKVCKRAKHPSMAEIEMENLN